MITPADVLGTAGRVHAFLIEALEQDLGVDFARGLAGGILCEGETPPCMDCISCQKVARGTHLDLLVFEGEGKAGAISVEQVRKIRGRAFMTPNDGERKVLLLVGCQAMHLPAQNALLKILEEPPGSTVFILTATNRSGLLETVRSRVRTISLEDCGQPDIQPDPLGAAVFELISRGDEGGLLVLLAEYEKDRATFAHMAANLRGQATRYMLEGGYNGGGARLTPPMLWAVACALDKALEGAQSNLSPLVLGCALTAGVMAGFE